MVDCSNRLQALTEFRQPTWGNNSPRMAGGNFLTTLQLPMIESIGILEPDLLPLDTDLYTRRRFPTLESPSHTSQVHKLEAY